jgi:multidrug efflux pump subunit AcrA (membrane-fusion protein)
LNLSFGFTFKVSKGPVGLLDQWKEQSMAHSSGKKTAKRLAVFITTAIIAAGLLVVPSLLAEDDTTPLAEEETAAPVYSVRVTDTEQRTLYSYLEVNGDIVSDRQVRVFPEIGGKLASVRVVLGSVVQQGDLIAEVNPSRPGLQYQLSPVYAPISGTVSSSPLATGSTVSQNDSIAVISVIENLQIESLIPEREVSQLRTGLKANVTLQAYPGEVFTATIVRVSPVLDPASRTKKIVLTFDKNDARINAGMFARVALNTATYENIVTVPAEALMDHFGVTAVYVLNQGRAELREVLVGVTIDRLTEIKKGVEAGEKVLIQGQQFISDGAPVRVIAAAGTI